MLSLPLDTLIERGEGRTKEEKEREEGESFYRIMDYSKFSEEIWD